MNEETLALVKEIINDTFADFDDLPSVIQNLTRQSSPEHVYRSVRTGLIKALNIQLDKEFKKA